MSKMFLTMEEAAEEIGKSVDDVKKMIEEGKLQEFKQNDEIMIKSDQLALLADEGEVNLDDSMSDAMSLEDSFSDIIELDDASSSGSAIGLADSNEATGISAFDTALAQEPPAAAAMGDDEFSLDDNLESGSQMLDLTRESDDSMVGAELMTQSFEDEEMLDLPSSASGIFNRMDDDGGAQSVAAALGNSPMSVPVVVEEYDGASSGMALGGMITAALAFIVVAIMATGGTGIASWFNSTMGLGIPLIVLVVLLAVGFVVGRATD
ncbi:MAG: hypothetical protein CMJ33_10525 [Phycisphaerae bacterium]|nr:hypothetical protein [Phycisphaerae bacterium]HAW95484.1 hypothetical protein [Phycisphaerales bacterium]